MREDVMRIVFFGSGQFALPIAKKIRESYSLIGVVFTKPKPRGRGQMTSLPEIAQWAQGCGIKVYTPENPNEKNFCDEMLQQKADLFVLSSYGHILSGELLKIPRLGGINIHPSLLPKYRGAAPIQRTIMAGESKTGITVIFMDEKIDHGDVIFQRELSVRADDNYSSLATRLSSLGTDVIVDIIRSVETNSYTRIVQDDGRKTYAPKIKSEERVIDWKQNSESIHNLIRALSPKPGARTRFRNKDLIILSALVGDKRIDPGKIHIDKKRVYVGTGNGSLVLKEIKPENRKVISGLDFINGFRIEEGEGVG